MIRHGYNRFFFHFVAVQSNAQKQQILYGI